MTGTLIEEIQDPKVHRRGTYPALRGLGKAFQRKLKPEG